MHNMPIRFFIGIMKATILHPLFTTSIMTLLFLISFVTKPSMDEPQITDDTGFDDLRTLLLSIPLIPILD